MGTMNLDGEGGGKLDGEGGGKKLGFRATMEMRGER